MFYLLRSSAIVCDHDRRIAEVCFHMIADDRRRSQILLRSAICDPRSYGNQPLVPIEKSSLQKRAFGEVDFLTFFFLLTRASPPRGKFQFEPI